MYSCVNLYNEWNNREKAETPQINHPKCWTRPHEASYTGTYMIYNGDDIVSVVL